MPGAFDDIFAPAPGIAVPGAVGAGRVSPEKRAELGLTDRGCAYRLVGAFPDDLVWCPEWGWGVWDGGRYDFDAGEVRAFQVAQSLPELLREEAKAWAKEPIDEVTVRREIFADKKRPLHKKVGSEDAASAEQNIREFRRQSRKEHAKKLENVTLVERALKAARPLVRTSLQKFDADPEALAVPNGTLRLERAAKDRPDGEDEDEALERRARWLDPHDRAARPTRVTTAEFDPAATCPNFEAFVALIQPRPLMAAYLQRACGQLIAGRNEFQKALLWQGEGANGKSTLMNILTDVLGSHIATCKIEMFLHTETRSSSAPTPDEADLPGARAYTASEPEPDASLSDAKLKAFTGGDRRKSRRPHSPQGFEWQPRGVPVLSFNRLPSIKGDSYATRRRMAFVPFEVNLHELPPDQRRTDAVVMAEMRAERSGILNWLLEGYAQARAMGGLHPPPEADLMKDALLADADPVGEFMKACCLPAPAGKIRTSRFFDVYAAWAEATGSRKWQPSTVKRTMAQKGWREVKERGYPTWKGLEWAADDQTLELLEKAEPRKWTARNE